MYSLVASDLDGTLLNQHHVISKYTKSVLQQLDRQGIGFSFATGRHHHDVAQIKEYVATSAYMITSNGACIHSPQGELIYQNFISPHLAIDVISLFADDPRVKIHLYNTQGWLCSAVEPLMNGQYEQSGFAPQLFDSYNPPIENIFKIFITCADPQVLREYLAICQQQFGEQVLLTSSGNNFLEINAAKDSKGNALQFIADHLKVDIVSTIAFGDSMNDQSMLEIAGRGLITDNADPRLISTLPHLEKIGHHADDAVANYLETHLLTQRITIHG